VHPAAHNSGEEKKKKSVVRASTGSISITAGKMLDLLKN
jgi:hypothetical protein